MDFQDIIAKSNLSPVQLAKSIKSLKSITQSEAEYEKFKQKFIPDIDHNRITQIITGLEQEDEFAILCRLMGTCQSLVGINQTPIIENSDEVAPDFLATFIPGSRFKYDSANKFEYKCFIEVKSTQKDFYKISQKDFDRRVNFAKRYHLPLIFAIRFLSTWNGAFWTIIEADYLEANNRRIDISTLTKGIRHLLFDEYFLMPIPNLHIVNYYDTKVNQPGIKNPIYGTQVKTVLLLQDLQYEVPKKDQFFLSVILNSFDLEEIKVTTTDNLTVQILRVGIQPLSLCDMLYKTNNMALDTHGGRLFDPSRLSARFDSGGGAPSLFLREYIEYFTSIKINSKPLFYSLGFEEPVQQFNHLQQLCSKKY